MKILYLHQYFATPNSSAGTRSYEMAKRFVKNGHDVEFITSSAFISSQFHFHQGWNQLELDGIKLNVLHMAYSNKDSFFNRIIKFINFSIRATIKALTIKSDVVLATSTPLTIAIPAVIYSKIKNIPMVFEVRDLWPELPIAIGVLKNPVAIKLAKWLEVFAYKNAKRLVGLSPGMCDGIIQKGIAPELVTLATNSCDTSLFDVSKDIGIEYKLNKWSFVNGRKLVVYTGTFGLINNIKYMVELALSSLKLGNDICFVAIGDGMQKNDVVRYAEEIGVLNVNFYVFEPVAKTEIVRLLSAADLSLSLFGPIKEMWHNSANKLFDALASGTPIAINYGGWQQILIEENQCGVVLNPYDTELSASILHEFLYDDEQYQRAKNACHQLAYNEYSRDFMAKKLEDTLVRALND
ncbi:glycosyltransferase involved in cell wall biosynthesis [Aeromonas sp. BIGb0405]|uniref:glycosyltransferase family 4 protein n=1 Tax=Aeromonas sp. BIGb0405 TaxID=2940592 RepID=UPI0021675118|nr:glycosyltransferase family 4 protein [Aeromonas sp. BIGb0405]MCS3455406.1 glycosyltransferase involved in cell wall biosynthesis [Aeromonas sp. BIGb0405]